MEPFISVHLFHVKSDKIKLYWSPAGRFDTVNCLIGALKAKTESDGIKFCLKRSQWRFQPYCYWVTLIHCCVPCRWSHWIKQSLSWAEKSQSVFIVKKDDALIMCTSFIAWTKKTGFVFSKYIHRSECSSNETQQDKNRCDIIHNKKCYRLTEQGQLRIFVRNVQRKEAQPLWYLILTNGKAIHKNKSWNVLSQAENMRRPQHHANHTQNKRFVQDRVTFKSELIHPIKIDRSNTWSHIMWCLMTELYNWYHW